MLMRESSKRMHALLPGAHLLHVAHLRHAPLSNLATLYQHSDLRITPVSHVGHAHSISVAKHCPRYSHAGRSEHRVSKTAGGNHPERCLHLLDEAFSAATACASRDVSALVRTIHPLCALKMRASYARQLLRAIASELK